MSKNDLKKTCILLFVSMVFRVHANQKYGTVIGIDLGTTYSCVGVVINNRVEIIANNLGNRITPSYVAFTNYGDHLVGDAAKNQLTSNIRNTIFDAKRLIGREFSDPILQNDLKYWPFKVLNKNDKPYYEIKSSAGTKLFSPEEISAMVLAKMKETAEAYLGKKVTHAVVTVPAYFNNAQREATKNAGRIAGLTVLRIINEPTAAALAYGLDITDEKNILVFDLGGGTFDVSVLTCSDGVFQVLATDGDTHLGGQDFDNRVIEHLINIYEKKTNKNFRNNQIAIQKLRREVEIAKRTLSSEYNVLIDIDSFYEGNHFSEKLTRARFEELNIDLFQKTLILVQNVLEKSGLKKSEIDEVILVGGSTRIPKVQQLVKEFFNGKVLNRKVDPDEAVAFGAAVQADILSNNGFEILLIDVNSLTLGIEVHDGSMSKLISSNTIIPTNVSGNYTTVFNYQESISIKIYEGEHKVAKNNHFLDEFLLEGIESALAGIPRIKVSFEIDADGLLKVTAIDYKTGNKNGIVIHKQKRHTSEEEIIKMKQDFERLTNEEKFKKERDDLVYEFNLFIKSLKTKLNDVATDLGVLNKDEKDVIRKKIMETENWYAKNKNAQLKDFKQKKNEIEECINKILKLSKELLKKIDIIKNSTKSYEILGLDQSTCEIKLIEKYYRKSAKIVHPDKNSHPEANSLFDKLTKARDDMLKCSKY